MRLLKRLLRTVLFAILAFYGVILLGLLYLRFLPPLTTAVQIQRRVEALASGDDYNKRYDYEPLEGISDHLEHAVVAAEDTRFFEHHGFDWTELRIAVDEARRGERTRGASTLTQQLIKNLFLTTHRSPARKAIEWTVTPLAEVVLGKERILELYLNVIEWGRGVYGAEAAAQRYYDKPAAELTREQAARLAAIIPAPRTRMPDRMGGYSRTIQQRMRQMGW